MLPSPFPAFPRLPLPCRQRRLDRITFLEARVAQLEAVLGVYSIQVGLRIVLHSRNRLSAAQQLL